MVIGGAPMTAGTPRTLPTVPFAVRGASLLVVGQVKGDVDCQPQTLAFGAVPYQQEATRQIVLTGNNASALDEVRFASGSPWLSVDLAAPKSPLPRSASAPPGHYAYRGRTGRSL